MPLLVVIIFLVAVVLLSECSQDRLVQRCIFIEHSSSSVNVIYVTSVLHRNFRLILIPGPIHVKGKLDTSAETKLKTDKMLRLSPLLWLCFYIISDTDKQKPP